MCSSFLATVSEKNVKKNGRCHTVFFLSKIKLCAVNTAKVREWNFTFFEKFMLSVLCRILLTQVLLKCTSSSQI